MKMICLPYTIEKIVKSLCYISVVILDILNFILTPITWVKFKAHVFMALTAAAYYAYLTFITHQQNALWIALGMLIITITGVALIKSTKKLLNNLRQALMKTFYSPLGICFYMHPLFTHKNNTTHHKLAKCGVLD